MSFLSGFVVGLLTIVGAAYVHDSTIAGSGRDARTVVNWSAASDEIKGASDDLSAGWNRLTGNAQRP